MGVRCRRRQHKALGIGLRHDKDVDHAHFVAVTPRDFGDANAAAWAAGQASTIGEAALTALEHTRRTPSVRPTFTLPPSAVESAVLVRATTYATN
jgi:hypothetical protein